MMQVSSPEGALPDEPLVDSPSRESGGSRSSRRIQFLLLVLFALGLIVPHVLIGGVKLCFSIPGYVILGVAGLLVGALSFRRIHAPVRWWPVLSAIALATYVVIRSYTSPVEYLARTDRYMAIGALLVYWITAFYLTNQRHRLILFSLFLVLAAVNVGTGLVQFFRNDNFMLLGQLPDNPYLPRIFRPDYGERASGFLGCPNHLAGFLEALGLVALSLTCLGRWKATPRVLMGAATLVCLFAVSITGSRGGYLSTAVGLSAFLFFVAWVMKKLRPKRFLLILMVAILTTIGMVTGGILMMSHNVFLTKRMETVIDTGNMRSDLWSAALQQYHLNPVVGTGSGTYLYYGRKFRTDEVQHDPVHVHNDYLELLCEYGIVGAVLAAAFIGFHVHSGWKAMTRVVRRRLRPAKRLFGNEMALILGVLMAVIALLAHSVVDFNCHIPSNTLFFAFLFGILASPSSDPQVVGEGTPRLVRPMRFAVPALGITLIALTAPLFAGEYFAEWARMQLRCKEYLDLAGRMQPQIVRALPIVSTGVPFPTDGGDLNWPGDYAQSHIIPRALSFAERGIFREKRNPDLFYYLGEARHFQAVYEIDRDVQRELYTAAAEAYLQGIQLFPEDVRLLLRAGRTFDNLGMTKAAEAYLSKAIEADPRLSNVYANYGVHLWRQRQIVRAEGYYRKALSLLGQNEIALRGLQEIAMIRRLSATPEFVEEFGDPMETYQQDPPTPVDEARGIKVNE